MGADRVGSGIDLAQLGAQRLHVGVDGALAAVGRIGPGAVEQLRAAQDGARAAQQLGQQRVLVAGELEQVAIEAEPARVGVVLEAPLPSRRNWNAG